uniref:Cilia- and flagella-associated protein 157 n=1 Tax=Lotharella oceanica TaxID=641309 RepID=A0A7S2TVZ5_9EUKA|mmetsp:Transcript_32228/g.60011  ORF Transcript_32228/g.60011 Transcript_32228/m.60011 type:complete len:436 (+) Transcript_32228:44-1351(+)
MPPKKKKGKAPEKTEEQKDEENELDIMTANAKFEKDRNDRLTKEYDLVKKQRAELEIKLTAQKDKQRQIEQTLRREITNEKGLTQQLKEEFAELKAKQDTIVQDHDKIVQQIKADHKQEIAKKDAEYLSLKGQYSKIAEFKQKRDKYMKDLEEKENEIKKLKRKQDFITVELESRHLEETQRLNKKMNALVTETKDGMLAMTKNQLHATTKRTIQENENMSNELLFQTREMETIMKQNNQLKTSNKELKRRIELLDEEQKLMVKRSTFYQKMNKRLTERLKELEQKNQTQKRKETSGITLDRARRIAQEMEMMQNHIIKLEEAYEQAKRELAMTQIELEATRRTSEKILSLQDEGTTFLLACMQDAKLRLAEKKGGSIPDKLGHLDLEDREAMLEMLLEKLNKDRPQSSPNASAKYTAFPPIAGASRRRNPNSMT